MFYPHARPSNPQVWNLPESGGSKKPTKEQIHILAEVEDKMDLHRALLRGNGFYDWMTKPQLMDTVSRTQAQLVFDLVPKLRPLPVLNFLNFRKDHADAIVREALPQDRERFREYLSKRPLGLGIIAAAPGLGKTTAGAAATAAMAVTLGPILCSAPTHVATDNFAARLDRRTREIAADCNKDKQSDDASRIRHHLVVRAYPIRHEVAAFMKLLQNPNEAEREVQRYLPNGTHWKLHLSLTFWVLVLLGSESVRKLHEDDSERLWRRREGIPGDTMLRRLHDVVTGTVSWDTYSNDPVPDATVTKILGRILDDADMLCTTPAATHSQKEFKQWKTEKARGVAVDEAAAMNQADLYCVWGNTLLPCFLFGDPKQLPPTVMSAKEKDANGNFLNRFALCGTISPLQYLQATGIPVYRLRTQLRMANGMFDMIAKIVYPGVPHEYAERCMQTESDEFAAGRALESYIQETYPSVKASPKGKLLPVFAHVPGCKVRTNRLTNSKECYQQVKVALDIAVNFVAKKRVDPTLISIIAPYSANVKLIDDMLAKNSAYEKLKGIKPPSTVDSFHGQENDLIIVVLGTAYPKPGPGFTTDEQRMNVMFTRHKCGLVIVGDINVTGMLTDADTEVKEMAGKRKRKRNDWWMAKTKEDGKTFEVINANGEKHWTSAAALKQVNKTLYETGRFFTLEAPPLPQY